MSGFRLGTRQAVLKKMADDELQDIRAKRLAELQAQYGGVSTCTQPPGLYRTVAISLTDARSVYIQRDKPTVVLRLVRTTIQLS